MTFQVSPKDTFLIVTGSPSDPDAEHLFIIVAGPCPSGKYTGVTISTYRPEKYFCEDTCVIAAGEHEFCTKESFVRYGKTRLFTAAQLATLVSQGNAKRLAPVSDELMQRICAGVHASAFVTPHIKSAYAAGGGP